MEPIFQVIPRLPAKDLEETRIFFETHLNFSTLNRYPDYLVLKKGNSELHFFSFAELDPLTNYAMVYLRMQQGIEELYADYLKRAVPIHPNGALEIKPWRMKEFAVLDPNHTLITFGQPL